MTVAPVVADCGGRGAGVGRHGGTAGRRRPAGRAAGALLASIRFYQRARAGRPSPCRYLPSCSQYALEAVTRHGAARGSWLAVRRLGRCHPWGGHGADPVPE